jgi:hypothetical protein
MKATIETLVSSLTFEMPLLALVLLCSMGAETRAADVSVEEPGAQFNRAPPLVAVLAAPSAYDGQVVLLKGVLVSDDGEFAVYLSRDDARYGIHNHAVRLTFS